MDVLLGGVLMDGVMIRLLVLRDDGVKLFILALLLCVEITWGEGGVFR